MRPIVWSYGGGTQSAAIAALIASGELPKPDLAVIADTGREVESTWDYLRYVVQPALDFEVRIVPHSFDGSGYNTVDLWGGKQKDTLLIPAFTNSENGELEGKLPKYCSQEWKTRPVHRFCRELGISSADMWIGFSTDEMERCRTYREADQWPNVYPLIEKRMSRGDCIALVDRMGWPTPPRSACWMCPYRSDHEWREIHNTPDFQKATLLEREIQARDPHAFLHRSCQPIDKVDFSAEPDLFAKPCNGGMCFT